jgi:BirA family biotin operon repressor/biotin-[acetyl-CoA-carboxylase] ligase
MIYSQDTEILRRLREGGDFVSGSDLGEADIVSTRIDGLRAAGYEIEHHPFRGYRLVSGPDRLIADDILSRLPECSWIREVLVFQKTASTNDVVSSLGRQGAPGGVAVFAEEQTAGRGRLGRRWQSEPGLGLWFSILLRPQLHMALWPRLTGWLAYAVTAGIREATAPTDVQIALKWPNDLYASGRKLAGILVESSAGQVPYAVAGIGLNVNHLSFPRDLLATSLRIETGRPWNRNEIAACILHSIDRSFSLVASNFREIIAWASAADWLRGRHVTATAGTVVHAGVAEGLDPEGALLIRNSEGGIIRVTSGEVNRFSANG